MSRTPAPLTSRRRRCRCWQGPRPPQSRPRTWSGPGGSFSAGKRAGDLRHKQSLVQKGATQTNSKNSKGGCTYCWLRLSLAILNLPAFDCGSIDVPPTNKQKMLPPSRLCFLISRTHEKANIWCPWLTKSGQKHTGPWHKQKRNQERANRGSWPASLRTDKWLQLQGQNSVTLFSFLKHKQETKTGPQNQFSVLKRPYTRKSIIVSLAGGRPKQGSLYIPMHFKHISAGQNRERKSCWNPANPSQEGDI